MNMLFMRHINRRQNSQCHVGGKGIKTFGEPVVGSAVVVHCTFPEG